MMSIAKAIATVFGIGYLGKGSGTIVSIVLCVVWYSISFTNIWIGVVWLLPVLILGVWSATLVEGVWGKDSSKVVIDELVGMAIPLLIVPKEILYVIIAFILFRFFDIVKPLGIKKTEKLHGGWGVIVDDLVSGIYALIIMEVIITLKLI